MQYKFEDIKGIIRSRTSKNDRECNHHKKKDKRINNDLPTLQRKLKIVPLTTKGELMCSGRAGSYCFTSHASCYPSYKQGDKL
jgi:hypothetical protein